MSKIKEIVGEKLYDLYKNTDLESLKREGQAHNFVDVYPLIVEIFDAMKSLDENPDYWNFIHQADSVNISTYFRNFMSVIERINQFDPTQGNPNADRKSFEDQIRNTYNELNKIFLPKIDIFLLKKQASLSETAKISKKVRDNVKFIEDAKNQVGGLLKSTQEATSKTGISKFANIFAQESKNKKGTADKWLALSIISVIGLAIYIYFLITVLVGLGIDYTYLAISNTIALTISSYVIYQFFRNYNVNMHLHTLNKHRENSLKTFETFVKSTDDDKIKDAILVQATKTIFDAGETGFVNSRLSKNPIELIMNRNNE